jgi:hypothetical protein
MDEMKKTEGEKHFIGIIRADFDPFWVPQKDHGWCWTACQESVFKFYGIEEDQSRIAVKLCGLHISSKNGARISKPAPMNQNINHYVDLDINNKFYTVNIMMSNEPVNARYLLKELQQFRPVIVFSRQLNRSLLVTGAQVHLKEEQAVIKKLYIRDPEAEHILAKGRRVVTSPKKFLDSVQTHWYINTRLLDIPAGYNQIVTF